MTDGSNEKEESGHAGRHEHGEVLRAERVAALAKLFEAERPPDLDEISGPVYWPGLSVVEAGREWNDVRTWVEELVVRFPHLDHHVIPRCWFLHNGHVEALVALRDHERVTFGETAPGTAAVDWHRAFRDIRPRLREWTGQLACGATHEPRSPQRRFVDADEWNQFVSEDVRRRDHRAINGALVESGWFMAAGRTSQRQSATNPRRQAMAIKTEWPVEHRCGHREEHDLSGRRPSERAGYARWLSSKDCSICWRGTRGNDNGVDNETWLTERHAEEAVAIRAWERRAAMGELDGSDKSIPWGARVRYQLLSSAHDHHVANGGMSEHEFADRFEVPARTVTSASWWIDQRDTDPADMEELLADVSSDIADSVTQTSH